MGKKRESSVAARLDLTGSGSKRCDVACIFFGYEDLFSFSVSPFDCDKNVQSPVIFVSLEQHIEPKCIE